MTPIFVLGNKRVKGLSNLTKVSHLASDDVWDFNPSEAFVTECLLLIKQLPVKSNDFISVSSGSMKHRPIDLKGLGHVHFPVIK